MRTWDKYCEDTEKAFKDFRDCIWQPVRITGYLSPYTTYLNQLNILLHPYWDKWVVIEVLPSGMVRSNIDHVSDEAFNNRIDDWTLVVLRAMKRDTVHAYTEMRDIHACGMRKSINRLGNAFNWPNVRYRDILPLEEIVR